MEAFDWKKLLEDKDSLVKDKIKEEIKANLKLDKRTEDKIVLMLKTDGSITDAVVHSDPEVERLEGPNTLIIAKISPYDVDEWLYYRAWIENKIKENGEIESSVKEEILTKHIDEYLELEANTFIKDALEKIDFVNW